jgi:hypothetical protein
MAAVTSLATLTNPVLSVASVAACVVFRASETRSNGASGGVSNGRSSDAAWPRAFQNQLILEQRQPEWLDLKALQQHACVSERTIRDGLRWGDFQFGESASDSNRYILVQRRFYRGQFRTPKGNRSRRVDMSRGLRHELLSLRDTRML